MMSLARPLLSSLLAASLMAAGAGCESVREHSLTVRLWEDESLRHPSMSAQEPNLALFRSPAGGDVLVIYDELREGADRTVRRAYFLDANLQRVKQRTKPVFVSADQADTMTPVPVIHPGAMPPAPPYAVFRTNVCLFTLRLETGERGPYALPVYEAGSAQVARATLTPFALVGDLVVVGVGVGAIGGFIALVGLAHYSPGQF